MAILSKKVYLSPSSFLAFLDRAHTKHEQAGAFFRYFGEHRYRLYTDYLTIYEVHKQIHFQISPALSRDFMRTLLFSNINIICPQEPNIRAALKMLINYHSIDLTFGNALIAILANKRDITQICTFDYLHSLFGQTAFYLPI